jgi:DNA ligase-associated metallophosphoesterase
VAERDLIVAGESVALRPERAVWWPARRTLLVADLHLGKEAYFGAHGIPIPASVIEETLERLDALVVDCGAERVVVVGDLVHGTAGMTDAVRNRVAAWRRLRPVAFELVVGNHDRRIDVPASWGVRLRGEAESDGPFRYRHDPAALDGDAAEGFTWCGHLHPTVRLADRVDRLVLPCFALGPRRGLIPAFTAFSRGVAIEPGPEERVFAIASGRVIPIRAEASAPRRPSGGRPSRDSARSRP